MIKTEMVSKTDMDAEYG